MESELGWLSRLAWVAYQRQYRAALAAGGRVVNDWDPERRAYREALAQVAVTALLKEEHFGFDLPPRPRDLMVRGRAAPGE